MAPGRKFGSTDGKARQRRKMTPSERKAKEKKKMDLNFEVHCYRP